MIRVVFIEDAPLLREAISEEINRSPGLLCTHAFAAFEDAEPVLAGAARPDVVLMDLSLPGGMDGIEATCEIKERWPLVKVLIFSMHEEPEAILPVFTCGADGYLLKTAPAAEIADAIRRVHEGLTALSPHVQATLVAHFQRRRPLLVELTPLEKIVLKKRDQGDTYKKIAADMGIAFDTVKFHAKNIVRKSLANSITEASHLRRQLV